MRLKTTDFDYKESSFFPKVGRYHLVGFDYDSDDVYAVMAVTKGPDGLGELDAYGLRCNFCHLAALHDVLPEGDERDYIRAIHDAVECLNTVNMSLFGAMRMAQNPSTVGQFNEEASYGLKLASGNLEDAIARIQAFGGEQASLNPGAKYKLFP